MTFRPSDNPRMSQFLMSLKKWLGECRPCTENRLLNQVSIARGQILVTTLLVAAVDQSSRYSCEGFWRIISAGSLGKRQNACNGSRLCRYFWTKASLTGTAPCNAWLVRVQREPHFRGNSLDHSYASDLGALHYARYFLLDGLLVRSHRVVLKRTALRPTSNMCVFLCNRMSSCFEPL